MSTLKDLLVDKNQILIVNPKLAEEIGLNEALFLQQLDYWINIKKNAASAGEDVSGYADNHFWVFKTLRPVSAQNAQHMRENNRTVIGSWQDEFPWWSLSTIRRIIDNLVGRGLVLKGNFNRLKMDKTLWLTIDYAKLESMSIFQNEQTHNSVYVQNEYIDVLNLNTAIPETTKPENNDDDDSNNIKPQRVRRVRDADVNKLISTVSEKLLSHGVDTNEVGLKDRLNDFYRKALKTCDLNRISELSFAAIDRTIASTVEKSFVGYFLKILAQLLQRADIQTFEQATTYLTGSDRVISTIISPTELVSIPTDVDILNTDWSQFR